MKTIKSFTALAIAAASMMLFASKASAQELNVNVSFSTETSDSLEFAQQVSKNHPGGWNFDLIGLNISSKKNNSSKNMYLPSLTFFSGWGFGCSAALNADPGVDISMGRSFNFCIEDIVAVRMHPWKTGTLSLGYGIDLRNYTLSGKKMFYENDDRVIGIREYGSTGDNKEVPGTSKIRTLAAATFNLKYIQNLGRGFRLAVGPEVYITDSYKKNNEIKTTYDSSKDTDRTPKSIKTNKVGLNVVGILNYKNVVGVYAKYSPTKVIEKDFSNNANFQTLSVGLMLFGL